MPGEDRGASKSAPRGLGPAYDGRWAVSYTHLDVYKRQRRGHAYTAAVQGQPHTRMTTHFDAWVVEMARALAPIAPPVWVPMMEVVREKVTLEIGARGLRSLFSSKPSEKEVARVKRYGSLAVRVLRAVLSSDGPLDACLLYTSRCV